MAILIEKEYFYGQPWLPVRRADSVWIVKKKAVAENVNPSKVYKPGYSGLYQDPTTKTWIYPKNGKLDWKYSGEVDYEGKTYTVVNGKAKR